jgi:hypothetical protein
MAITTQSSAISPVPPAWPAGVARRIRLPLADGRATTVYVAGYDLAHTELRVVVLSEPQPLESWCADHGFAEALIGGFFVRPDGLPLGEVRTAGVLRQHVPFDPRWAHMRACVNVPDGDPRIAFRHELSVAPHGDLLQAGPMLVRDGREYFDAAADTEGFSAGAREFDSDITVGRHPRAALGIAGRHLVAVACDGRTRTEAGLTLGELAKFMTALGCEAALNLDGGGSTSMVSGGRLRNRPRHAYNRPEPGGRPISTALVFLRRPWSAAG